MQLWFALFACFQNRFILLNFTIMFCFWSQINNVGPTEKRIKQKLLCKKCALIFLICKILIYKILHLATTPLSHRYVQQRLLGLSLAGKVDGGSKRGKAASLAELPQK